MSSPRLVSVFAYCLFICCKAYLLGRFRLLFADVAERSGKSKNELQLNAVMPLFRDNYVPSFQAIHLTGRVATTFYGSLTSHCLPKRTVVCSYMYLSVLLLISCHLISHAVALHNHPVLSYAFSPS